MPDTVEKDIQEAKKSKSVNSTMTDEKIVSNFSVVDNTKRDFDTRYISWNKVFDTWDDFTTYAKDFFKE